MMAYLLRPAQEAKLVDDLEPGSLKDELLKDFDPSQETYEEYLQRKSMRENAAQGGVIGGGQLAQSTIDESRSRYSGEGMDYIYKRPEGTYRLIMGEKIYGSATNEKELSKLKKQRDKLIKTLPNLRVKYDLDALIKEWRKTLPTKDAKNWENFLKTKFPEGSNTPSSIRKRTENMLKLNESNFNPTEEYRNIVTKKQNLKKLEEAKKLVKAHNDSDQFLYDNKDVYKKLGLSQKPQIETVNPKTGKVYKSAFNEALINEVSKLMPMKQKVKNAFDKIKNENLKIYEPKGGSAVKRGGILKRMISDIVSRTGSVPYQASARLITEALSEHQNYLDIKDDFDYLEFRLAKKMKGKSFNEAIEYSKYMSGGLEMKNIEKFSKSYRLPEQNVMRFALRSAFNNFKTKTEGPVKIFNLKADGSPGKPIDFDKLKINYSSNMRNIDVNKIGFTYENQFFTKSNLRDKGFKSGLFDEVYQLTAKGNNPVPNPKNIKENIPLRTLLKINNDSLTIGHNDAKGGVTKLPFSNLRLEGGKLNVALFNAYKKIDNKKLRKLVVNKLQGEFGNLTGTDYEEAFINDQKKKASDIINKKTITEGTLYRGAGQSVIEDLGSDFFKQSKPFQQEAIRVAGIKSTDDVQTIINKINKAPIPNRAKALLLPIVYAGGVLTGADFLKKAGIGFDKEFEQTASAGETPLVEKGLSTGEQTAIGAGALGTYAARKPILKTLGAIARPVGKVLGAPSVAGGLSLSNILDYEKPEDASVLDRLDPRNYKVQDDPDLKMAGLDLLLPELIKKGAPRGSGIMSMIGRGLANPFGRAARVFTPVGATLTAAGIGKDYYDFAKDEIAKVKAMTPEERNFYNDLLMDEGGLLDW